MKLTTRFFAAFLVASALFTAHSICPAADVTPTATTDGQVSVTYASGKTELTILNEGTQYYTNHDWMLQNIPAELTGMIFTRRSSGQPVGVEIDAPAGATVYLLVNSDKGTDPVQPFFTQLAPSGWSRLADANYISDSGKSWPIAIFKQTFTSPQKISLDDPGYAGFVIAAKNLVVNAASPLKSYSVQTQNVAPQNEASQRPGAVIQVTPIAKLQSEIKGLEIFEQDDGTELGEATELILTADPGSKSGYIPVSFASEVGPQTKLVLDELMRWTHVNYPKISGTDKIEYSFEDKYIKHDGGSIGAACGTLILSVLHGFDVDPNIAMTGDISADGKVRAIGGVAAKLRGAAAAGCTLVALPEENYEQLVDAEIYDGLPAVTNTQVLGISTLDSAAAVARVDRDAKLTQAIDLFSQIQQSIKQSPDYLTTAKARDDLQQVLELAPNHLSAKVLLSIAQGTARTRLTASASEYYTLVAVNFALPMISDQLKSGTKSPVLPAMVDECLNRLRLVHQRSDPQILPMIDAWQDWIEASSDYESGNASDNYLESKRLAVLDAMTRLQANRDLIEKMLHEGM
ncbi:MAG: S16 family serine protease [Tepidisphaeraceae bacterium]